MPNRIIKESICTSEDIGRLSPMAEILFYRLMVKADDYGAYYGNISIIKSNCFPLKSDDITCNQVESWLNELFAAGLIVPYESDGRKYVYFQKWEKHQQIRAKKRKFPEPDINGYQMISDDCKCSRNPIQSNPNTNPNPIQSNIEAGKPPRSTVFKPPTVEDVQAYCEERQNGINAQQFVDFYESKGWLIGKSKMRDWKAAVRTWERRDSGDRDRDTDNIFLQMARERQNDV